MGRELTALASAVALQVLLTAVHGAVHVAIPVRAAGWRLAYVVVVLFAVPIAGVLAAHRGHLREGAALVAAAGVAGLAFEGLFHFAVANSDHVGHVSHGWLPFASTAVLSTAGDALAASVAGLVWWRTAR